MPISNAAISNANLKILKILVLINISALFYVGFLFIPSMIRETERFHKMKLNLLRIEQWLNNKNIQIIKINQEKICIYQEINKAKEALDNCINFWRTSSKLIKIVIMLLLLFLAFLLLILIYQNYYIFTILLILSLIVFLYSPRSKIVKIEIDILDKVITFLYITIYMFLIIFIIIFKITLNKLLSNSANLFFAIWAFFMVIAAMLILYMIKAVDSHHPYKKYWEVISLIEEGLKNELDEKYFEIFKY